MSAADLTREEIEHALRLEDQAARARPGTAAEVRSVTARIYGDWAAAREQGRDHPDVLSFIRDVADTGEVTNENRGSTRAFWSFKSQPEGAPRVIEHRFLAQACGASRGYQVLEETPAGRQLDSYYLWEPEVQQALAEDCGVEQGDVVAAKEYVWSKVSERYAHAAEGPVVAFATDIFERSVLGRDEMPILLDHENVGKEGVRFPLPMPRHEHLPPEIDALIADPAIRAQIRMQDFSPENSPKDFAAKLAGLDIPESQREAHEGAVWRLATANSYDELATRAEQNQTPKQRGSEFTPGLTARPVSRPAAPRGPTGHGVYNPSAIETPAPAPAPVPTGVEI